MIYSYKEKAKRIKAQIRRFKKFYKIREKKFVIRISKRFVFRLIFFVCLIFFFILLFFSSLFTIKNIIIVGNKVIESQQIKNLILKEVKGKNIFLVNLKKPKEHLLTEIPRIKDLKIYRIPPGTIKLKIIEKSNLLCWITQEKKYLINSDGTITSEIKDEKELADIPCVNDLKNLEVKVGNKIVTGDFVLFVNQVYEKLPKRTGLLIESLQIEETTFDLKVLTDRGFYILFNTTSDFDSQLKILIEFLKVRPKIREYVDLRIPTRVFYK